MKFTTLDIIHTRIASMGHEVEAIPRGDKRRRILQDQLRMWQTFAYTDKWGYGFTLTKEVKNHRISAFERFADDLVAHLSLTVTGWTRDGDTITFHPVAFPVDNTIWVKGDQTWMMPQRHPMWR